MAKTTDGLDAAQIEAALTPRSLTAKIARAALAIGKVAKNGENTHFKFKYQAWDDVVPAVRDAIAREGLWLFEQPHIAQMEQVGGKTYCRVELTIEIVDVETNESRTFTWPGESIGSDDKLIQKAATSAMKYALLKLFLIPCHGDTDPDETTVEGARPQAPAKTSEFSEESKAYFRELNITDKKEVQSWKDTAKAKGFPDVNAMVAYAKGENVTTKVELATLIGTMLNKESK